MNQLHKLPAWLLGLLGLSLLARGVLHYFVPDSGAGIIAGMDLSLGNGADIIFLLGAAGVLQMALGVFYIYFAVAARQCIGFALAVEVVRSVIFVFMEYTFKMPVNPVPGRYVHVAVMIVAIVAGLVYLYTRGKSSPSSSG